MIVFLFSGSSKIRAKRVCCCFDMCHHLFEIDAYLKTDFCVGCPVTLRTITAKIYLQTSSLHCFKKMYVSCRVYLRYYFTTRNSEPTVLVACPVSCLRFFENAWTLWAPNIIAAYMYVSPVNKTAKNKNVTTKTLKNYCFAQQAPPIHSANTE